MRSVKRRVKKKLPRQPWQGASIINSRVPSYATHWHKVDDWAGDSFGAMDVSRPPTKNPRIATLRGVLVNDILDDEEAYERAIGLESIQVPRGPSGAVGGRRRVMIRLFTWVPDKIGGIAYAPQWIVAGHGMSAHSAAASLARYIRSYTLAVSRGIESRRLIVTAMDIVWWTEPEATDYV